MKITRSNYEAWFADWLDNNLNDSQVEELNVFLAENPDLLDELNELKGMVLKPAEMHMSGKSMLFRLPEETDQDQFSLLCAAAAENDLTEEQISDFNEILTGDSERRKTADVFKRIRLLPEKVTFPHKRSLLKKTAAQKIITITLPILGAAAAIVFAIIAIRPQVEVIPFTTAALEIKYDNSHRFDVAPEGTKEIGTEATVPVNAPATKSILPTPEKESASAATETRIPENVKTFTAKIGFPGQPAVIAASSPDELIASTATFVEPETDTDDSGRSRLGKMLAFKFREKVLKEDLPEDTPIKAFEIAEAGVSGLNKLLGWDMALSRNTEAGENGAVQFSSRLIKFTAPVKNDSVAE